MERKLVVVGDPPASGGHVLPYAGREYTIGGNQVALIGGRAYCEGCQSVGTIAKAGGTRRIQFISEIALEGDVVVCHCPTPRPLRATLQHSSTYDDMGDGGEFNPTALLVGGLAVDTSSIATSKKLVDAEVEHPPEAEQHENICPNMTNKEFAALVMGLRDEALAAIAERLQELERWDSTSHARILRWFGDPGVIARLPHLHDLRVYLQKGLMACAFALRELTPRNFVRWSPTAHRHLNCTNSPNNLGLIAEVCRPDVKTRTIAIATDFCLSNRDYRVFGTNNIRHGDSQLLTLVHEITHFDDVFGSSDHWYRTRNSLTKLAETKDYAKARENADSLSGYILGVGE